MKIIFAHEITDYSVLKNNYNIFYLDYDFFNRIQDLLKSMKDFSCKIENLFGIILLNKYNIDIGKVLIIEFEFFQMKERFQKLFPNFQYLKIIPKKIESFIKVNPGQKNIFSNISNINIDNNYCISYNEKKLKNKLSDNDNKIIDQFATLECSFEFYTTNNKDILFNHIECIKNAKKNKYKNIIIFDFKNDLIFDQKMIKQMIVNNPIKIPKDFNICYLNYNINTKGKQVSYRYDKYVLSISNITETFAYILNESAYDILLNKFNSLSNVDLFNNNLKSYGIYPILCTYQNFVDDSRLFYSLNRKVFQTIMVNLDRRTDRMEKFYKKYGDVYPNIIRFSAVDGKTHDFKNDLNLFDLKILPLKKQKNMWGTHQYKAGTLGCALSHYNIWNKYMQIEHHKENDFILILEDDINLCDDFNIKLNDLIDDLDKDPKWGICFLGFHDFYNYNDKKISDKLIRFSEEARHRGGGTFAYIIRKKAAKKLVHLALKHKIQQAIDFFMIEQMDEIVMYKADPELVFSAMANNVDGADSDVQNLNKRDILKNMN